ncbi:MAG: hypothetical protein R3345_13285 [Fulvivirga sp.]|nr:hypothetical protein [Fulvivirga sp.]
MREKAEILKKMYAEFNLTLEDVHETDEYTEIKKSGIKKVINRSDLIITKSLVHVASKEAVVQADCYHNDKPYTTFGEASPINNTFHFPVAVAEKRAEGRIVVDIMRDQFDGVGILYSEDELRHQPKAAIKEQTATDKGEKANEIVQKAIEDIMGKAKKPRKKNVKKK